MRAATGSRRWVTAKIAWSVATTAGMATVVVSVMPGEWAAEAFESLRFATLLYGTIGAWDFVSARGLSTDFGVARRAAEALHGRRLSQV